MARNDALYEPEVDKLVALFERATLSYRLVGALATGKDKIDFAEEDVRTYEKHAVERAHSEKRAALRQREWFREHYRYFPKRPWRRVAIARTDMYLAECTYWMQKATALQRMEQDASCKRQQSEARRMLRQGKADLREASDEMYRFGGSEEDMNTDFQGEPEKWNALMETFQRRFEEWFWEDWQATHKAMSAELVSRVILTVRERISADHEKEILERLQTLDREQLAIDLRVERLEAKLAALKEPPSPPSPEEQRNAMLARLRKANAAKAAQNARAIAERKRVAKELEAQERQARAHAKHKARA